MLNYTQIKNASIQLPGSPLDQTIQPPEDWPAAEKYLKDNFRSFSEGLKTLIKRCTGKNMEKGVPPFLRNALSAIGVEYSDRTLRKWCNDESKPKRSAAFHICFALNATFDDTVWFFEHVYFERAFNCHTIEEAVYYYCIKHGYDFAHANHLLSQISSIPVDENIPMDFYPTQEIQMDLDSCEDDDMLLHYFSQNKAIFYRWNQTAKEYLMHLTSKIKGDEAKKPLYKQIMKNPLLFPRKREDFIGFSLLFGEFYFYHGSDEYGWDLYLMNKDLTSDSFMFYRIFEIDFSKQRATNASAPEAVVSSLMNESIFKVNISDTSTNYDTIRKQLILLKFYEFWASAKIGLVQVKESEQYKQFTEEIGEMLTQCGYGNLYAGNPFDWLFLWASTTGDPLSSLRDAASSIFYRFDGGI